MRQLGKKEGFKKEAAGFAARWLHGTGALGAWQHSEAKTRALVLVHLPTGNATHMHTHTHARARACTHVCTTTGEPLLSAALSWDARQSQLLLALRQSGSKAVLRGALRGADPGVAAAAAAAAAARGSGTCQLKVLVRELDAVEEHCVQVGGLACVCVCVCVSGAR
jgi:hypothetical protein